MANTDSEPERTATTGQAPPDQRVVEHPITVVGCGALGSLISARLIQAGFRVQVLQRAGEQFDVLARDGIVLHDRNAITTRAVPTAVATTAAGLAPTGLVIVLLKAGATAAAAALAPLLRDDAIVLSLQNGLGNGEALASAFGRDRVALGIGTYGAHRSAPGEVHWGGDGYLKLGPLVPSTDVGWVVETLAAAGFAVTRLADPWPAVWTKLIHNLMINTVSALTRQRNGLLKDRPESIALMRRLGGEALRAAALAGVSLDFEEVWASHRDTLERTANNRTSMLQDVEAGRVTEIDAIAKPLLDLFDQQTEGQGDSDAHAADLVATIRTVYQLIKAMEPG